MKRYLLIFSVVAVSACLGPVVDETQTATTQMIGMSKADLVACAGPPTSEHYGAAVDRLSYLRTEKHGHKVLSCTARFDVYRDHVSHISYDGLVQDRSQPPSPCINIVSACLK